MKLIKLPNLFQPIEFSLSKFDRLEPSYQTSKARIRWVGKDSAVLSAYIVPIEIATEERSYDRFLVFSHAKKQGFSKTLKISASKSLLPKNDKNLLFNGGLFQQDLST